VGSKNKGRRGGKKKKKGSAEISCVICQPSVAERQEKEFGGRGGKKRKKKGKKREKKREKVDLLHFLRSLLV